MSFTLLLGCYQFMLRMNPTSQKRDMGHPVWAEVRYGPPRQIHLLCFDLLPTPIW